MRDYRPEWDYEVAEALDAEQARLLADAEETLNLKLSTRFGWPRITVFAVVPGGLGERVAVYVNGTASAPFVGVDLAAHLHHPQPRRELLVSLAHEAAHAYQESTGREDPGAPCCEATAETFAQEWVAAVEQGRPAPEPRWLDACACLCPDDDQEDPHAT